MNTKRTITLTLALAATTLAPAAALARHGADDRAGDSHGGSTAKHVTGACSRGSSSKLKLKPSNQRLETEFEVDQNRSGVRWKVTIRHNGRVAVKTNATTKAPSGSFSIERRLANVSGSDRVTATASSPSGEVCRASVTA